MIAPEWESKFAVRMHGETTHILSSRHDSPFARATQPDKRSTNYGAVFQPWCENSIPKSQSLQGHE